MEYKMITELTREQKIEDDIRFVDDLKRKLDNDMSELRRIVANHKKLNQTYENK